MGSVKKKIGGGCGSIFSDNMRTEAHETQTFIQEQAYKPLPRNRVIFSAQSGDNNKKKFYIMRYHSSLVRFKP